MAYITGGILDNEYFLEMANQWMGLDNYKRAILNLEKAIKIYDISHVRYCLAWCYHNLGEFEKASINYEKAYEKQKHGIYLVYLAYCKYCMGKKDEASKILNEIKESKMNPELKKEFERIENIIKSKEKLVCEK